MINIMYAVDPIKRIVKPMSGHAVTEQDHEASSLRFAFPDNIAGTGLDSTGTAVRVMYIRPDGGDPVAKTLTFYKHSGGYYLYDWDLQKSDLQKEGRLVFSLCILDISGGEVSEWHTTPCAVRVLPTIHTDDSDEGDDTITPTVKERVAVLETMIQRVASGAPIVVASASDMTDTDQIYVLSTNGEWYYHNGSAWVAGGEYGGVANGSVTTDKLADGAVTAGKIANDVIVNLKDDSKQSYEMVFGGSALALPTETVTRNGVTFTATSAGITANGTATVNAIFIIDFTVLKSGNYRLSGCPSGGTSTKYYQCINGISGMDTGSGAIVELTERTNYSLWIVIVKGKTVDNITFSTSLVFDEINLKSLNTGLSCVPCKVQIPPLFEGGISSLTGQYYHDTNETWVKARVRTYPIRIARGSKISTSGAYKVTICRYADYSQSNYINTIESESILHEWTCPEDGFYTITFARTNGNTLSINDVISDWDFSNFYCLPDERIHIRWIGSGNQSESATYTDSGDCALVVCPDGTGILIDGANKRNYTSIRKRLAEAGFYHIKNIIVSHFHDDHIGGIIQLVKSNYIDITDAVVYLPDHDATLWAYDNGVMGDATKALYDEAMAIFDNNNCTLVYPNEDFKPYAIGGIVVGFYNTDLSYYEGRSTNYNDWSLCNYIFYGDMNINFAGDLGPIGQSHLGGSLYKSNIYKADHHGWLNQTTIPADYINNVSPDVVIALDGQVHDQYIGTDTAPLIKWCDKYGVPYYRKYTNNEIVMTVSKNSWAFETKVKRTTLPDN